MTPLRLQSEVFKRAPHPPLVALLNAGPMTMLKMPIVGKVACTVSYAATRDMLKEPSRFVVDARHAGRGSQTGFAFLPRTLRLMADNMLMMDDPAHRRLRRFADAPFRRAVIETLRPMIETRVHRLLDDLEQNRASGTAPDLVSAIAQPLPVEVISDVLGLSDEGRSEMTTAMSHFGSGGSRTAMVKIMFRLGAMRRMVLAEITRARLVPQPGLLGDLIAADHDGDRLSDDELFSMLFLLYVAGHDTTTHLLATSIYTLLSEPGAWRVFQTLDASQTPAAVAELMRFGGAIQIVKPRYVTRDGEHYGMALKRGQRVMGLLATANLDADVFEDPLRLNLTRSPNRHIGWGGGPHLCLGLHLATLEAEIVLREMARRYPELKLAVPAEAVPWVGRLGVRAPAKLPLKLR